MVFLGFQFADSLTRNDLHLHPNLVVHKALSDLSLTITLNCIITKVSNSDISS